MIITKKQYSQFHDYLTQLSNLSGKDGAPQITQKIIATKLKVDPSGVCRFLTHQTEKPKKMMSNFTITYPLEFQKWPLDKKKIDRILEKDDLFYFLGLPQPLPAEVIPELKQKEMPTISTPVRTSGRLRIQKTSRQTLIATSSHEPKASIAISYRGQDSDKDAQGMVFDHMRLQMITRFPTSTLLPEDQKINTKVKKLFTSALKNHPAKLLYGEENSDLITHPSFVISCADLGLLIIPGRVRQIEDEPLRLKHEYSLIRGALNRGQPILGICAGSWRIWEQLVIWSKFPSRLNQAPSILTQKHKARATLVDVKDHVYNAGMIRLDNSGMKASYNVQIHDVVIEKDSLLATASKTQDYQISVNSVHWKAVNPNRAPLNVKVSAVAKHNPSIQKKTRNAKGPEKDNLMKPEENVVEAFETEFGTPIIGLQWHPEGYNPPEGAAHSNLLKYMALAGNAYSLKRKMLKELKPD